MAYDEDSNYVNCPCGFEASCDDPQALSQIAGSHAANCSGVPVPRRSLLTFNVWVVLAVLLICLTVLRLASHSS